MQSLSRYNKRTERYGPANNPILCSAYASVKGNLGIFEAVDDNGIVFAQRRCLLQKVAMGMENIKIRTLYQCKQRTGRYGPANNAVSAPRKVLQIYVWEFSKPSKTMVPSLHQANVYFK